MSVATPPPEWHIDVPLVRSLLGEQHPDLAHLPLEELASGWDNKMYRLGDDLVVRLPRRSAATGLLLKELQWLPRLADRLPLPIPAPVRTGVPTSRYPPPWSVVPWFHGSSADEQRLHGDQAVVLAQFLKALHVTATSDLPRNPVRGVPLSTRGQVEERLARLERKTPWVTPAIRSLWERAVQAPLDEEERWLHGDLHARNLLVDRGRISAVIDWGDLCRGDRATDLAAFWMLFPNPRSRQVAMNTYGPVSEHTWLRARGWAVGFAAVLLDTGLIDHPAHAAMGERTFRALAEDRD